LKKFLLFHKQNAVRNHRYDTKTKFIQILLQYGLNDEGPLQKEYLVQSEDEVLIDNFKIIQVNTDKITKLCYTNITREINQYKYLIMLNLPRIELETFLKGDKIVEAFKSKIFHLNDNERFLNDITKEEEQMLVINTGKALAFEDGVSHGLSEGIEKGEKKQKIEIAKEMLLKDFEPSLIQEITKLSIEEIEQIKSTLY